MKKSLFAFISLFILSITSELNVYGMTMDPTCFGNFQQDTTLLNKALSILKGTDNEYQTTRKEKSSHPDPATSLPTPERIKQDLVGHSLSEGLHNGYHPDDWVWLIEDEQIDDLEIVEVLEENDKNYVFIARMVLSAPYYSYNVNAKIKYTATPYHSWNIDYILSLGMTIMVTHEYDMCIRSSLIDDGWGGITCIQFRNISEMSLAIGGDFLSDDGWQRFSTTITPHSSVSVGGTLAGGSVKDYRINFIVRIN